MILINNSSIKAKSTKFLNFLYYFPNKISYDHLALCSQIKYKPN